MCACVFQSISGLLYVQMDYYEAYQKHNNIFPTVHACFILHVHKLISS
jgi:hypothetical protein